MGVLALESLRDTASIFDHFQPALNVAFRIVDHLAVLGAKQFGKLLHVMFDQFLELEHHTCALLRIGRRPAGLDRLCCRHRFIEQSRIAQGNFSLHFAGRGVPHLVLACRGNALPSG